MAARLNPQQDERTRSAIRTTQLVKRLEGFALSEMDPQSGKPIAMSKEQVAASLGLLRKTLPDLSNVQLSGEGGGPIQVQVTIADAGSEPEGEGAA